MKWIAAIAVCAAMYLGGTVGAFAYPTYVADPPECNCVTAIAGNVFVGFTYAHSWDQWFALGSPYGDPVTSITVTVTVSGAVERSSWG